MTLKKCGICKSMLPLSSFYKSKMGRYKVGCICKPCFKIINRQRYEKNREKQIEQAKSWRKNNMERYKEYFNKYTSENRDKRAAWGKASRARNADKIRLREQAKDKKRRHLIAQTENPIKPSEWRAIIKKQNGACYYCCIVPKTLTVDHVIPLVKGGKHTAANIVGACGSCNSKKRAMGDIEWANRIGRLFV